MAKKDENNRDSIEATHKGEIHSTSRRAMLKGTVTAMPAILTLHSGAALARSSNLISTTRHKSVDREGRTLCLDLSSVKPVGRRRNLYDMGRNYPYAHVNAIPEREYFVMRRGRKRRVDAQAVCERGGSVYHKEAGQWKQIKLPKGGMMSATSMASMAAAGHIDITDI